MAGGWLAGGPAGQVASPAGWPARVAVWPHGWLAQKIDQKIGSKNWIMGSR